MFPARAGMNRIAWRHSAGTWNVPRPCGDEPENE